MRDKEGKEERDVERQGEKKRKRVGGGVDRQGEKKGRGS